MNRFCFRWTAGTALGLACAGPVLADRVSVLVFDASGSMWNRVEGDLTRIEVARDVMGDYFASRDGAVPLSVIAYGHNRRGDCADIEVVAPMGQAAPGTLETRLRALMPRGMTPLTDSLRMARGQVPPTAEAADIILVTDGLETCSGDPCALAAELAAEGIDIRAHVVGFGLTGAEVEALSCITDQTGGMLFQTNSGAELADALRQVSAVEPEPAAEAVPEPQPEPEPDPVPEPAREAAFDIGDKAEAGFAYSIRWNGEAGFVDYIGFVPQGGTDMRGAISYGPIGGTEAKPNNPVTRTAPAEPGMYDLVLVTTSNGIIARQAVEVVSPQMGFEAIGSVEPGSRVRFAFRGPERIEERIVIAHPDQPIEDFRSHAWAYALHKNGAVRLTVPEEPGEYEIRYLNRGRSEILFARRFGVGIPFADADLTSAADLAAAAAAATQGDPMQDMIAAVSATFRLPPGLPDSPLSWDGIPLDPDMQPEAWAPMETGPVISGEFEPGTWRITARAPGEVIFTADLEIFPGQANDFTLAMAQDGAADGPLGALDGRWTVWAIPPRDSGVEPPLMMHVTLEPTPEGQDYTGSFATDTNMGGVLTSGDLTSVIIEDGSLFIEFPVPQLEPAPFRLALAPQGAGFVGTLGAGTNSVPVALWPEGMAPDLPLWQDAASGPAPQDETTPQDIAFSCTEPRCELVVDGLAATLQQGWSMGPPAWVGATAGAQALDQPRVDFHGPEGAMLHLNPHQWLDMNGPCMETAAGLLCLWADGPPGAALAAVQMATSLQLVEREASAAPEPGPVDAAGGDPQDGMWDLTITGHDLSGCPAQVASAIGGEVAIGQTVSRDITWPRPFSPAPLTADNPGNNQWAQQSDGSWSTDLVDPSGAAGLTASMVMQARVISPVEIETVSIFSTDALKMLTGETCVSTTRGTARLRQ
ncbi:vWA domain-containing protein [Szabonella alba]|uniref:VWA domain-containing protein n=1 Tax=Szabonella alba TaxID=2804194 RepID=A0A8K0V795_9RHOB|nr:VWA domain-containing protein [Szabonella alba]MBL4916762.1 VWA domain-containing protein [Szabonella alba]